MFYQFFQCNFSEDYVYSIANSYNYYSVPDCIKFLSDIVEVADKFDLNLIIKLKRNNPFLSKKYLKFLDKLKKRTNIHVEDTDTSARSIILKSSAVISALFTSTNSIGKYMKKPSIFYNPAKIKKFPQPSYENSIILNNKKELKLWIGKKLNI